jgi:hypothetical protein
VAHGRFVYPPPARVPPPVWAYDCVAERTHDGRPVKILTVVDEYARCSTGRSATR